MTAFADWLSWAGGEAAGLLSSPRQIAAVLAAAVGVGLVVAGAFVRTMQPLRWLAAGSNAGLLVYGALHREFRAGQTARTFSATLRGHHVLPASPSRIRAQAHARQGGFLRPRGSPSR